MKTEDSITETYPTRDASRKRASFPDSILGDRVHGAMGRDNEDPVIDGGLFLVALAFISI